MAEQAQSGRPAAQWGAKEAAVNTESPAVTAHSPQYSSLLVLSWLHFLNDGSANYLPGILPAVLLALHQSTALAGTVMGVLLIGQALQVITGWWADRVGGRLFIAVGVLGSSVAAAAIPLISQNSDGKRFFLASGPWDWLGTCGPHRSVGAGGRNRSTTPH